MLWPYLPSITLLLLISLRTVLSCSPGSIPNCQTCEAPPVCQACSPRQVFQPRTLILTSSNDYDIRLTDFETKVPLLQNKQPNDIVRVARFSPLGNLIAAGDEENFLWLFEPFTMKLIKKWSNFRDYVFDLTFSPDQSKLVGASEKSDLRILIFDLATKNLIGTISNPHGTNAAECLDYDPKNHKLASTGNDNFVRIWDDTSPFANFKSLPLDDGGECVRYNSDGSKLAGSSNSPDSSIYIWNLITGSTTPIKSASKHSDQINKFEWSPDNTMIAAASLDDAKIWSTSDGSLLADLTYDAGDWIYALKFFPDGSKFTGAGKDKKIYFWNEVGCFLPSLTIQTPHTARIRDIDVFPTKNCFQYTNDCPICLTLPSKCTRCKVGWQAINYDIISGSNEGMLNAWDEFANELFLLTGYYGGPTALSSSPDFKTIASAGDDLCEISIKLSGYPGGEVIWEIQHAHVDRINSVVFSPDANWIASASTDKTIKIWNVGTRCLTMVFFENTGGILLSRFYNAGLNLISFSDDNAVAFWDLTTGKKIREETMCSSIICADLSPDNLLVAVVSQDNYINMMFTETWTVLYSLLVASYPVLSISFSPDGANFATGHSDNSVKIWETDTGCLLHTFEGHTGSVLTLRYFPDGKKLATGSEDKTLIIWDIENKILLETLYGNTGAVLACDIVKKPRCQEIRVKDCNIYGDPKSKCTKCNVNYYLFDKNGEGFYSECIHKDKSLSAKQIISKPDLDGSGVVVDCSKDTSLSFTLNNEGTCVTCSSVISDCLKCTSNTVCTMCNSALGYKLRNNKCSKCHEKCLTCSSYRQCTSCPAKTL